MKAIQAILKHLTSFLILFTLVNAPVVFKYGNFKLSLGVEATYAQDSQNCDAGEGEENASDTGYYKKGCAFKDTEKEYQGWEGNWTGFEVINYLVLLVMSMVFLSTLNANYHDYARRDCPQNTAASISMPMIRWTAAAHIVEEIIINAMYEDEAEKTAKAYSGLTDGMDFNDANAKDQQIEAFDKLERHYVNMRNITVTRTVLHSIMEAIYIAAGVVEVVNVNSCKGICSSQYAAAKSAALTALGNWKIANAAMESSASVMQAQGITSCMQGAITAETALARLNAANAVSEGKTVAKGAKAEVEDQAKKAEMAHMFGLLLSPQAALTINPATNTAKAAELEGKTSADLATKQAEAAEKLAQKQKKILERQADKVQLEALDKTCIAEVQACVAKCNVAAAACIATCETPYATWVSAKLAEQAAVEAYAAADEIPVQCCGTVSVAATTTYGDFPPQPSIIGTQFDVYFTDLIGKNNNPIELDPNKIEFQQQYPKILKALVYNMLMKSYMDKAKLEHPNNPQKALAQYHKYHLRAEALINASPTELMKRPFRADEVKLALTQEFKLKESPAVDDFAKLISSLSGAFFTAEAQAFDFGSMLADLGVVAGALAIALYAKTYLQKWFLKYPNGRIGLYAILAGLGATQIVNDGLTIDRINDHLKIVRQERAKFKGATEDGNSFDGSEDLSGPGGVVDPEYDRLQSTLFGNSNMLNCNATQSNNPNVKKEIRKDDVLAMACSIRRMNTAFDPDTVPRDSAIARAGFNLNDLKPMAPVVNGLANGVPPNSGSIQGGDFGNTVNGVSNALKAVRDKLLKKEKDDLEKQFGKKSGKKGYLAGLLDDASLLIKGAGGNDGGGNRFATAAVASSSAPSGAVDNSNGTGPAIGVVPNYGAGGIGAPPVANGADWSFGEEKAKDGKIEHGISELEGKEKNLDSFVLNYNDINKKPGVSIFKLLSNRYLIQYPKLLEKIEAKKNPLQEKKLTPPKDVSNKGKLKEALNKD